MHDQIKRLERQLAASQAEAERLRKHIAAEEQRQAAEAARITRDDLKHMSATEVNERRRNGELDHLLGR